VARFIGTQFVVRASYLILTVSALALMPHLASAEVYLDLYGGVALSGKTDAGHERSTAVPLDGTAKTLRFDSSGTVGVRGGVWLDPYPWFGVAADLSFFQRKADAAHIDLVPLSTLVMLRYPLSKSDQFPKGRLHPYIGAGPSVVYSHASINFGPPFGTIHHGSFFGHGVDVRGGLHWQVHKYFGLFTEYRFTQVTVTYDEQICPSVSVCIGPTADSRTEFTLNTHHVLMGIRF
jgi:Outer membrane protein beta-barrel domain